MPTAAANPNTHTHRHYCPNNNNALTSHTHTHPYSLHRKPNLNNTHQCAATKFAGRTAPFNHQQEVEA